jgi:arylsulfatase A
MKHASLILALALTATLLPLLAPTTQATDKPNILLIYGDDVGYGDVGVNGSQKIPTPNIDKLASQGLNLTDAHCTAATCTPSRFSLLTGIHGFRHGVRVLPPNAPLKIPPDTYTLADLFKEAGYSTAVIGKWHLGLGASKSPANWNGIVKPGPLELGFDYSFLLPSTNDRVPCTYLENHRVVNLDPSDPLYVGKKPQGVTVTEYPNGRQNREAMTYYKSSHGHNNSVINGIGRIGTQWGGSHALWNDETMADVFVEKADAWIGRQTAGTPFFLYFASQDIHVPRAPHPRFQGKTTCGYRGDAMVQLDWTVGALMSLLEKYGFSENTLVIFCSDNGPVYDDGYHDGCTVRTSSEEVDQGHDGSGPYRGGKYQIYEGGTRVPFIIKWPGKIEPGTTSSATVSQIDLMASFAEMLGSGLKKEQAIDSRNTLDAFLGQDPKGLPYMLEEARTVAIRQGPWKYIPARKKGTPQLYDLTSDIGEQTNIADQHPEKAEALNALLTRCRSTTEGLRNLDRSRPPQEAK